MNFTAFFLKRKKKEIILRWKQREEHFLANSKNNTHRQTQINKRKTKHTTTTAPITITQM